MTRTFAILVIVAGLYACGQNPSVPVDHFYNLNPENASVNPVWLTDKAIYVEGIRAEGIYNDRALLYSESNNGHELQQYHYHFWALPPAAMLREYLVEYLRRADSAPLVISEFRNRDGLGINGRLLGFEKIIAEDNASVRVSIELRLDAPGQDTPRLLKRYTANREVASNSVAAAVAAFNQAVDGIYEEFLMDAAQSLQEL